MASSSASTGRTLVTALVMGVWLGACGGETLPDGGIDAGVAACMDDDACSDGQFCNGVERCAPSEATADARGCVAGAAPTCPGGCDATMGRCVPVCADADNDGHPDIACGGDDCDDADPDRYPGNVEICGGSDSHDEDCDDTTLGADADRDGDGAPSAACCNGARCGDDCDDDDLTRRPGQLEICDSVDNDCDGSVDEEENRVPWYPDVDGDGFGDPMADAIHSCSPVLGRSIRPTDCDDTRANVSPVGVEACNGRDDDCDTQTDEELPGCTPDAGVPDGGAPDGGAPDGGVPDAGCVSAVYGSSTYGNSCYR